ncbi:unnamed protein product [Lactuca saligna]|uniref:Uncharacterized protein n=1 Tax=Lactuca saligna TaxID=75948 RepID=A0AA35Z8H3_LACSI|nr:unnamed protein product [Lactuca saligna]
METVTLVISVMLHPKHHRDMDQFFPCQLMDALSINIDEDDYFSNHTREHFTQPPPSAALPSATSSSALEMQKALCHLNQGPTIPQCLEKLELLDLGPVDPLQFAVYHIFGETMNIREMWVNLPNDPHILRGWIEMTAATSLGVLKDIKIVR